MFWHRLTGKLKKSTAAGGGRGRSQSRNAKRDWTRHVRFEALEDRYLLSAGPTPVGSEQQVNTDTGGQDYGARVASDAAGDYVVVWQNDNILDARRYNAAGVAQGSEFQVNIGTDVGETGQTVAMDSAGGFVVAWEDYDHSDGSLEGIYARIYSASGVPQGSEFRVDATAATTNDQNPKVAMDSAGDFVIAWNGEAYSGGVPVGGGTSIYAQRYNAAGVAQGSALQVNTYTTGLQNSPSVAMDSAGDFVVSWMGYGEDGSNYDVYAQRFNAAGRAEGSEFQVNTYTTGVQDVPSVAMDSAGDFVITWQSSGEDGSSYGIYAQRYSAAGAAEGSEFQVNTYTTGSEYVPSVRMDSAGDFVVTWERGITVQSSPLNGVYAQAYTSSGVAFGSEFQVNTYTVGGNGQFLASIAVDSRGDFVVAWNNGSGIGSNGISAQQFAAQFPRSPVPAGSEFQVNTYTTGNQDEPAVATDAAGDYVVVWQGDSSYLGTGAEGSNYGIYALRYSAAGVAQGSEFLVSSSTTGDQLSPAVAMDSAGDFVIAWKDAAASSVFSVLAQRYNAIGVAQGSELLVNASTANNLLGNFLVSLYSPAVAMDSAGDFVVTWGGLAAGGSGYSVYAQQYSASGTSHGAPLQISNNVAGQIPTAVAMDSGGDFVVAWTGKNVSDIEARLYNAGGVAQRSEFRVNSFEGSVEINPSVAMDSSGDFVVAWTNEEGGGIYAHRYNASGVAQGTEFQVNTYTTVFQVGSSVAMDAAGDFVVAWGSYDEDGDKYGVSGQRYSSSGAAEGSEFRVNTYTTSEQNNPSVAMDSAGDFVVAWQSFTQDGNGYGIYAQRYAIPKPEPVGSQFQVNTYTTGNQDQAKVAMDAAGDYVVVWQGESDSSGLDYGIYAQRYNAAGVAQGSEFVVSSRTTGDQIDPNVAMDAEGDFVITWAEDHGTGSGFTIYAQPYNANGVAQGSQLQIAAYSTGNLPGTEYASRPSIGIAMDAAGDFVTSWTGPAASGTGYDVYAQRYAAAGNAQGSIFQVSASTADNYQAVVAMDAEGDFVVEWQSAAFVATLQRYNANGVAQGSNFALAQPTNPVAAINASVAMDSAGDFVVAWMDFEMGGVYADLYNASGVLQQGPFQVCNFTTTFQNNPSVAMDAAGDFVVTWESSDEPGFTAEAAQGTFARYYFAGGVAAGGEFLVSGGASEAGARNPAVAMDAEGDYVITWQTRGADGSYGIYAQRYSYAPNTQPPEPFTISGTTLTISSAQVTGPLFFEFEDATDFDFTINGTTYAYNTSQITQVDFDGQAGSLSEVVFYDPLASDEYTATQSLTSTTLVRSDGFEFTANNVPLFYAYVSNPASTASVTVGNGTGANYYVEVANGDYSYIADPIQGIYSEISGFGPETVTGSGGSTYAYVYSTAGASFVGDPGGSTFTVGGLDSTSVGTVADDEQPALASPSMTTLTGFPQQYVVGASDGGDSVTLQTEGGSFVGTPSFSSVSGTFNGQPFLIGALYAANVTAQATNPTDSAFFYSGAGDTFNGTTGSSGSTLTGSASGFASFSAFATAVIGFQSVVVAESGSGTDVANLTSPGFGTFISTPTVSTLALGGVTAFTILTSSDNNGTFVAVPSQVNVAGAGSDTGYLYDGVGSNALVAQASTATLTRAINRVSVSDFGLVIAEQTLGNNDTVDTSAIDFALRLIGNWTSG